jgi:hypothetical protein
MPRKEVVFIADDFGMNAAVNAAIIRAHRGGALHGASLMLGQPGTDDAVRLAREHPRLAIGWHAHLCDSLPVSCTEWPWGQSPARAGWTIGFSGHARKLARRELAAQWEQFQATGLPCAFVNSHHHLHIHPLVYRALLALLPRDFPGWLRLGAPCAFPHSTVRGGTVSEWICWRGRRRRCPFRASATLWGVDRTFHMQADEVRRAIAGLSVGLHEFMFHPRRCEGDADLACLIALKGFGFQ